MLGFAALVSSSFTITLKEGQEEITGQVMLTCSIIHGPSSREAHLPGYLMFMLPMFLPEPLFK